MPASSFTAAISTGVYLMASGLFLGFVLPVLGQVHHGAEVQALTAIAGGLGGEVDSLVPGMTTTFTFNSPGSTFTLSLHDKSVDASMDGVTVSQAVRWNLPALWLVPGTTYLLSLSGGSVLVEETRLQ